MLETILITYYKVNGNDLRLRLEVMAIHFSRVTAKVTAVTYSTVQPTSMEFYMAIPYNMRHYSYGRLVMG